MFYLLFLHVALMFTAVALHAGPQLLTLVAARTGQLGAIGPITDVWVRSAPAVTAAFGLGAIFGLLTGLAFGYNLLAGWLILAYVLFIVSGMWSNFVTLPHLRRLGAAGRSLGAAATADVDRLGGRRLELVVAVDLLLIGALIFDMVAKPFV